MSALDRSRHLVRRFFEVASARRLRPAEQLAVARHLRPEERELFWASPRADQRHGHDAAACLVAVVPDRQDLVRALLLHDVGKRHSDLGPVGRAVATLLGPLLRRRLDPTDPRLRTPARYHDRLRSYLAHGPIGAAELAAAGAERVVVAFAAGHQRPHEVAEGVDPGDWRLLVAADDTPAKARQNLRRLVG